MRRVYGERHAAVSAGLGGRLADRYEALEAKAGVHLAAPFRGGGDERRVVAAAAAEGIRIENIVRYAVGEVSQKSLVLGCGLIATADIEEAMHDLARLPEPRRDQTSANGRRKL